MERQFAQAKQKKLSKDSSCPDEYNDGHSAYSSDIRKVIFLCPRVSIRADKPQKCGLRIKGCGWRIKGADKSADKIAKTFSPFSGLFV